MANGLEGNDAQLIPIRRSRRFTGVFNWYAHRLLRKRFHALRLTPESHGVIRSLVEHEGPAVIVANHPSWWDPICGIELTRRYFQCRPMLALMDSRELARFRFFTKVGVFGVNPEDGEAQRVVQGYVLERFSEEPRTNFWITPQGDFADPRAHLRLHPGAAAVAASAQRAGMRALVIVLAMEYAFWNEQKPEIFWSLRACAHPDGDGATRTTGWHRVIREGLEGAMADLRSRVVARDPGGFDLVMGGDAGRINPVMDLIHRARGQRRALGGEG